MKGYITAMGYMGYVEGRYLLFCSEADYMDYIKRTYRNGHTRRSGIRKENIMKICTCESCHYTFRYPILPPSCPDCGQKKIRLANKAEIKDYHRLQAILAEEIRMGLYAATG